MQLEDLSVERDAYGQPLSPTHLGTNNRTFNGMSPAHEAVDAVKSQSYNLLGKSTSGGAGKAGNTTTDRAGGQVLAAGANGGHQAVEA
jgi:hypothetical protein